ncbi:MAG: FtsK/SpoIIIE domain-containing protein [Hyphomicrobium sp.]
MITPAQLAQARALVATRLTHTRQLDQVRAAVRVASASSTVSNKMMTERLKFRQRPELLAGLAELYQRNAVHIRRSMDWSYEHILSEMIDPLPALDGSMPKPRAYQVDFHALPRSARPYFLGPYLGVHPGDRFARLCLQRSRPSAGILVILQTGGPIDADLWRTHLPSINAWLGGSWSVAKVEANTITLIQRAELPAVIPMQRGFLRSNALFLGIDTDTQQPTYLPFASMTSGTFVVGGSGSGKSNATHVLMQSILANLNLFQAVFCIDGKQGMTFTRYRRLHPDKLRVLTDEPDVWALTTRLVEIIRQRNATLANQGLDNAPNNFIAVLVDEMSTYTAKPSSDGKSEANKAHVRFLDELAMLARRGRSAGLRMLITAQDPTVDQIPSTVRSNCQTTMIFKLPLDVHATMMVGQIEPGRDPRKLTTGRAIIKRDDGTVTTVQFPVISAPGDPR